MPGKVFHVGKKGIFIITSVPAYTKCLTKMTTRHGVLLVPACSSR